MNTSTQTTQPKVSVIIPVYNAEEHLRECLDSIINQTLTDIEIICVDDGSTDGSLNVLHEYMQSDPRVKIMTQKNKYAGVARNTGMSIATGKYYVFLDSDDFFEPDLLEIEYKLCEKHGADIVFCAADKFDNRTKQFQPAPWLLDMKHVKAQPFSKYTVSNIYGVSAPNPWTKMFNADFVKKHGLQFQALQRSNDAFFVMSAIALARKIVATEKVLVHYRVGQTTNLQAHNDSTPDAFCMATHAVKKLLVSLNEFEDVEQSFANAVLAQIQYNLGTLEKKKEGYAYLIGRLKDFYIEEFELASYPPDFFYNQNLYKTVAEKCSISYKKPSLSAPKKDYTALDSKELPFVSLIVPVYNCEKYLEQCLESMVKQSLENIEIICVNDGSTDSSPDILKKYADTDPRITVINKENEGQFIARKLAVAQSRGRYIMFVDSDDYLELDACKTLYNEIRDREVDILQFGTTVEAEQSITEARLRNIEKFLAPYCHRISKSLLTECFMHNRFRFTLWNKIYNGDTVRQAMSVLPDDRLYRAEDLFTFFAIAYYSKSYLGIDREYYHYRFGVGMTGKRVLDIPSFKKVVDQCIVLKHIRAFLTDNSCFERFRGVFENIESQLLNEVIQNWISYLTEENAEEGLKLILESWEPLSVIKSFAEKYKAHPAELAKKLQNVTSLTYSPRKDIKTIGVFYHRLTPGGIQRVLSLQLPMLIEMGYKVILITDEPATGDDYRLPVGIERIVIPSPNLYKSRIEELANIIRSEGIDLFIHHATSSPFLLFDILTAKACAIPVCIAIHEAFVALINRLSPVVAEKHLIYRFADMAITLSDTQAAYWRALGVRARCILNPLTYSHSSSHNTDPANHNILWVGRIADEKNCADAVRILVKVRNVYPDATLTIVGKATSPKMNTEMRGIIAYYNIGDAINAVGETDNVAPYYEDAAVYLLTSLSESYSMTLAESKMFGLPAVMYDIPYIDLSRPEFGSICVPQCAPDAAAAEIIRLFSDAEHMAKTQELSANCRDWLLTYDQKEHWHSAIESFKDVAAPMPKPDDTLERITDALFFHYTLACKAHKDALYASGGKGRSALSADGEDIATEYRLVISSASYKIGRFITFIPRKIRGGVRCYREHGMRYTLRRLKEQLVGIFKK